MHKAVGFYWTLPVPYLGFTRLDPDIDKAATQSKTIAYQRALIRQHAKARDLTLIAERVYMEVDPDRGGVEVTGDLERLAKLCRAEGATLLYVAFHELGGWRAHEQLAHWLRERRDIESEPVTPEPVLLNGRSFDPRRHFRDWQKKHQDWTAGKAARVAAACERIAALAATGTAPGEIVAALNADAIPTPTGKPWSADNLRKFRKQFVA